MNTRITPAAVAALVAGTAVAGGNFGNAFYKVNGGAAQTIGAFNFVDNGAFASGSDRFNNTILASIHNELNAPSGFNVSTDNKLTFVLGQTSEGLSMFALFDKEIGGNVTIDAGATFGYTGTGFQNDTGDLQTAPSSGETAFTGDFRWSAANRGDGFAAIEFTTDFADNIFDIGALTGAVAGQHAQVVSLNSDGSLSVIDLGAWTGGTFAFAAVPMPAAGALAGVGLLGVAVRRRR